MARSFEKWLASLCFTVAVVWFSILWLDRPIALWVKSVFGQWRVPRELTDSPFSSTALLPAIVFVLCGLAAVMGRRFSKVETTVWLCAISALAGVVVKDQLKFVFGRTWPDSWGPGVLSFIHDGIYGFNYFHSGKSFESFPSGHATVAAAILSVPCILFLRLRFLCAICVIGIDIALVTLSLHFLSDVIAGTFTGFSTGLFTVALWRSTSFMSPGVVVAPTDSPCGDTKRPGRVKSNQGRVVSGK
jgi:membrane-associated phospholipid phosphatase